MSWAISSERCTRLTAPLMTVVPVVLLKSRLNPEVARPLWDTERRPTQRELFSRLRRRGTLFE